MNRRQALSRLFQRSRQVRQFVQRISTSDLFLPKNELRQLFHLVHPDKFQGDNLKHQRELNQQSLSQLNTIVDYAAQVWKDVSKNGERPWFLDRQVAKEAPLPCILQFYCRAGGDSQNSKLRKVEIPFDLPPRPSASVCLRRTRGMLVHLLSEAGLSTAHLQHSTSPDEADVQKPSYATEPIFQVAREQQNKKPLYDQFDSEFREHLKEQSDEKMQELYIGMMRRKFVQDNVHFHPRLEPSEREQAWGMMLSCCRLYGDRMLLTEWPSVPLIFTPDWEAALKLPSHVVALPFDLGSDEIIAYIQCNINVIKDRYTRKLRTTKLNKTRHPLSPTRHDLAETFDPREDPALKEEYGESSKNMYRKIRGLRDE